MKSKSQRHNKLAPLCKFAPFEQESTSKRVFEPKRRNPQEPAQNKNKLYFETYLQGISSVNNPQLLKTCNNEDYGEKLNQIEYKETPIEELVSQVQKVYGEKLLRSSVSNQHTVM